MSVRERVRLPGVEVYVYVEREDSSLVEERYTERVVLYFMALDYPDIEQSPPCAGR